MYLEASLSVWILLSLSEGSVGMILRKDAKASFSDWVRCLSLTFARTRWFCSSSNDWVLLGLGFLPRLFTELGLLLSSLDFLLCLLFLPNFFCCLSNSSSLVTRLSTGETGELELSSISFLKKWEGRGENALSTFESVVTPLYPCVFLGFVCPPKSRDCSSTSSSRDRLSFPPAGSYFLIFWETLS